MVSITPLGTCRITNPLRRLADFNVIDCNMERIYGYVHNTKEILQQIAFLRGEITFPRELHGLIGPNLDHPRCRIDHNPADQYFVEISSRKIVSFEQYYIQINHLARLLRKLFKDPQHVSAYFQGLAGKLERKQAVLDQVKDSITAEEFRLLSGLTEHRQSADELKADLAEIVARLKSKVTVFTHVGVVLPDGRRLVDRDTLIADVKQAAGELGLPVVDPTPAMEAVGQAIAMENGGKDLTHFTPSFERQLTRLFTAAAGIDGANDPALKERMEQAASPIDDQSPMEIAASITNLARNIKRMFMPFSVMNKTYISELAEQGTKSKPLDDFLEWAIARYDDEAYGEIQNRHLSREVLDHVRASGLPSPEHKYLDFPFWAHSKFNVGRRLNLNKVGNKRIVDIGAGPGHFGVAATYFGCDYLGLEVPLAPWTPNTPKHLFDDLCDFFEVKRRTMAVRPHTPLGSLDSKFDILTCQMGTFCLVTTGSSKGRPWNWDEWAFLLCDLIENVLADEFQMYFQMSRNYMPAEVWKQIARFAAQSDDANCTFSFNQTMRPEALRASVKEHEQSLAS